MTKRWINKIVNVHYSSFVNNAPRTFTRLSAASTSSIRDYRFFRYNNYRMSIRIVYSDIIILLARYILLMFAITRANGSHLLWKRRRTDSVVTRFWGTRIFPVTRKKYSSGIIFFSTSSYYIIITNIYTSKISIVQ